MRYLVDTNTLSDMRRGPKGNAGVHAWASSVADTDLFISVITIKEIELGILSKWRSDKTQALMFRTWLDHVVLTNYRGRILNVDIEVAQRAAALDVPDRRPTADGLIAATALVHNMTVATRNVSDFRPMGVATLNPFI